MFFLCAKKWRKKRREKGTPKNACILGKRSSKRKGLALNTFKAAVKAPAATRLCPEPRNATNKV